MKIVITGGTGLVGRYLSKVVKSDEVTVLSKKDCDITVFQSVKDIFYRIMPDVIFHLAAFTNVDLSERDPVSAFRVNVSGTNNIAFLGNRIGAFVVYVSTDFVFDGRKKTPYSENDIPEPISIYGKTKFEGERVIISNCRKYCILRTSRIFGKDGKNFASSLPKRLFQMEQVNVTTDLITSPTYAKDLAEVLFRIMKERFCGILHFSNSGYCSWYDFAIHICRYFGLKTELLIPLSIKDFHQSIAERPAFSALDTDLFAKNFYQPRSWRQALEEYLEEEFPQKI
ncbi:MAG: dTDP-4-dehydrorhamnose reductase [Candidatus Omnitrophica bacterium]|nr:dTDP-4-dehydrorhamnose reductase [Candidatus Omnitrophota bacterium]MCM8828228.1 dTDP-4-dehydrorhamnose reductase [Candidatus Omnitrophota bacterium]